MMTKYDLIQDNQGVIALLGASIEGDHLVADGYIVGSNVDLDGVFKFVTLDWVAVVSAENGCLAGKIGSVGWCDRQGTGRLFMPIVFYKEYHSYAEYAKENIEAYIRRRKILKQSATRQTSDLVRERNDDPFETGLY